MDLFNSFSIQCVKEFVCHLLDECRSTSEVTALLALDDSLTLERLQLAVKYEQKLFITHPHCQQVLTNLWYGDIGHWRQLRFVVKFFLVLTLILTFPLAALVYLLAPKSSIGKKIRSPFMKFLYHSTSFGFFLLMLVMAGSEIVYEKGRAETRGPIPSAFEWLVYSYVLGFIWNECKQVYNSGFNTYFKEWWNWLDCTMIAFYLSSIMLRLVAYIQLTFLNDDMKYGPVVITRDKWPQNDPTLVSEGLFAMANVFSFARIIFLFQANPHLGPLQISLGCMIVDISKFLLIFFLILTSFACGLNQLYWYYSNSSSDENFSSHFGNKYFSDAAETARPYTTSVVFIPISFHQSYFFFQFFSLFQSYLNLFWSLFGHTNVLTLSVPGDHLIVEIVGESLLLAYHAMAIIVLLNMLIASLFFLIFAKR